MPPMIIDSAAEMDGCSKRPAVDTVADISAIIEATRGSARGLENITQLSHGYEYLQKREYESIPKRADSRKDSAVDLYHISDKQRLPPNHETFIYHGFWAGPITWRIEIFIKSFLFTQNIALSQLWLWIDVTNNPEALDEAYSNPLTAQFHHLIQQGTLALKPWVLPSKIPIPAGIDHTDGMGFVDCRERREAYGFPDCEIIADSVMRDPTGEEFIVTKAWLVKKDQTSVAISDVVRFVVLHIHGGIYLDIDMLLLRDMRPLLLNGAPFAERWGPYTGGGDFNTAVLRLEANSSLSTYFLRAGVRLGLLFHPRIMGWLALKDGRASELRMLESVAFDPTWVEVVGLRKGPETMPNITNFSQVFSKEADDGTSKRGRNVQDFFAGGYAYHIHNQWKAIAEPGSWMDVFKQAHDKFFNGNAANSYNEYWDRQILCNY